jgi:hypothetical protein
MLQWMYSVIMFVSSCKNFALDPASDDMMYMFIQNFFLC